MTQKKIDWEKPELIILDRIHNDESVLLGCLPAGGVCNQTAQDGSVRTTG